VDLLALLLIFALRNTQSRSRASSLGHYPSAEVFGVYTAASKLRTKSARTAPASSAFDWTENSTTFSVRFDVLMFGGGVSSMRLSCSR
jgi:hypothetical protein